MSLHLYAQAWIFAIFGNSVVLTSFIGRKLAVYNMTGVILNILTGVLYDKKINVFYSLSSFCLRPISPPQNCRASLGEDPPPIEENRRLMAPSPTAEAPRQHGVKGAYVGGDWVDIGE